MYVILDTSILVQDFHLSGAKARTFIEGLRHLPDAGVGLPSVVVEEAINKYREAARELLHKAQSSVERLESLIQKHTAMTLSIEDVDAAVESYRLGLLITLGGSGTSVEVLPHPEVPHAEIVKAAINKRKPFSQNGAGYRDYLIWASVRSVLKTLQAPIAFITANTSDFGQGQLHDDLLADLTDAGLPTNKLEYYNDLQQFNEKHIIPLLTEINTLPQRLANGEYKGVNMREWVSRELVPQLPPEKIRSVLSLPPNFGYLEVTEGSEVQDIRIDEVYGLGADNFLIQGSAEVCVNISLWFDYEEVMFNTRGKELLDKGILYPGDSAHVDFTPTLVVEFEAVLARDDDSIGIPYVHELTMETQN